MEGQFGGGGLSEIRNGSKGKGDDQRVSLPLVCATGSLVLIIHAVHGRLEMEGWPFLRRRGGKDRSNSVEKKGGLRLPPPSSLLSSVCL